MSSCHILPELCEKTGVSCSTSTVSLIDTCDCPGCTAWMNRRTLIEYWGMKRSMADLRLKQLRRATSDA